MLGLGWERREHARRNEMVALLALVGWCGGCDGSEQGNTCAAGKETCTCYGNGTCDDGLVCASNLCVRWGTAGTGAVTSTQLSGAANGGNSIVASGWVGGSLGNPQATNANGGSVAPNAGSGGQISQTVPAVAGTPMMTAGGASPVGGAGTLAVGGATSLPLSTTGGSGQTNPICGDGVVSAPSEQCDPASAIPNATLACVAPANADTSHPPCTLVPGWACDGSRCYQGTCGNGIIEGSEGCDPFVANHDLGDGCSANCAIEPQCPEGPGPCTSRCGDGLVVGLEQCDDGNIVDGDGCSASCAIEANFECSLLEPDRTVTLPLVVRDFDAGGDFELGISGSTTATTGMVEMTLDAAGKPVLSSSTTYRDIQSGASFAQWYRDSAQAAGNAYRGTLVTALTLYSDAGSPYANRWGALGQRWVAESRPGLHWCGTVGSEDHDAAGNPIPCTFCLTDEDESTPQCDPAPEQTDCQKLADMLRCEKNSGGSYYGIFAEAIFDGTPFFFPADRLKPYSPSAYATLPTYYEGMWEPEMGQPLHNFAFTTETRFWFKYEVGQLYELQFVGDDDAWVFVNKQLAIDLGGIHTPIQARLKLSADGTAEVSVISTETTTAVPTKSVVNLGLVSGSLYEVAIFHAERQTTGSSYQLKLNGFTPLRSVCVPR